jgi:hypothetical protein
LGAVANDIPLCTGDAASLSGGVKPPPHEPGYQVTYLPAAFPVAFESIL